MPLFEVPVGYKFSAVGLYSHWISDELLQEINLGDDLWVLRQRPFPIPDVWRGWLGTIRCDELDRGNLWVVTRKRAKDVAVLDDEDITLSDTVQRFFLALLLVGPLKYEYGFLLTGNNVGGDIGIRQLGKLDRYFPSLGAADFFVGPESVFQADHILNQLQTLFTGTNYRRIREGVNIFWLALQDRYPEDRLHQFVRALDSLAQVHSHDEFALRCTVFAGVDCRAVPILRECYTLRSMTEHLLNWRAAIRSWYGGTAAPVATEAHLLKRTNQLEDFCRRVYRRMLISSLTRDLFINDDAIDGFWKHSIRIQAELWGAPIPMIAD